MENQKQNNMEALKYYFGEKDINNIAQNYLSEYNQNKGYNINVDYMILEYLEELGFSMRESGVFLIKEIIKKINDSYLNPEAYYNDLLQYENEDDFFYSLFKDEYSNSKKNLISKIKYAILKRNQKIMSGENNNNFLISENNLGVAILFIASQFHINIRNEKPKLRLIKKKCECV